MNYKEGDEIEVKILEYTNLGVRAEAADGTLGLLYKNEVFEFLKKGTSRKVLVKKVREDGRLDLVLQKQGFENKIDQACATVMEELKEADGYLPFTDKSDPEEIKYYFKMSKKMFKAAIGVLFKKKQIKLLSDGIYQVRKRS